MNAKLLSISLLTAGVLLATGSPASASGYKFTDLGHGSANGINNSGQVVGSAWSDYCCAERPMTVLHSVIWNGTTPTIFSSTSGHYETGFYPWAINDSGQVVGNFSHISYTRALIWNGTTMADLGTPFWGSANDINNSGQVAGSFEAGDGTHATIWDGTAPRMSGWDFPIALGTLRGGYDSVATGINDVGQVVGWSNTFGSAQHAVIWNGTKPTDLGTLGGKDSFASDINDAGQVVGYSNTFGDSAYHATIWNGTTPTDLGTLGGNDSRASDINDAGQVVGYSNTSDGAIHATLWNGTTATDLNSFLSLSEVTEGWVLDNAIGINDNGWIAGNAHNSITGVYHAFLLSLPITQVPEQPITQVPEPETYAMFLAGLGLMGFIARRRKNDQA